MRAYESTARVDRRTLILLLVCAANCLTHCPLITAQSGFGSVHINFETPAGYQVGFRDYLNHLTGADAVTSGPVAYVGNYSTAQSASSGSPFIRLTDSLNENGIPGTIIVATSGPDGSLVLTTLTDFDDLHTFSIAFDRYSTDQVPTSGAVDAINVVWYDSAESNPTPADSLAGWQAAESLRIRDWQESGTDLGANPADADTRSTEPNPAPRVSSGAIRKQLNGIGFLYGLRIIDRQDYRWMIMDGGILGRTRTEMFADNNILGPAAGLVWVKSRGPFTVRLQGLASIGYNSGDIEQSNAIGTELVPGAVNRLLYAQPTHSFHQDSHDEFSPNGELRADINMRITSSITFAMNWSGVVIDNALETENRTRFYLPDFGLQDPGNQRLIVHNFFCGFEVVR